MSGPDFNLGYSPNVPQEMDKALDTVHEVVRDVAAPIKIAAEEPLYQAEQVMNTLDGTIVKSINKPIQQAGRAVSKVYGVVTDAIQEKMNQVQAQAGGLLPNDLTNEEITSHTINQTIPASTPVPPLKISQPQTTTHEGLYILGACYVLGDQPASHGLYGAYQWTFTIPANTGYVFLTYNLPSGWTAPDGIVIAKAITDQCKQLGSCTPPASPVPGGSGYWLWDFYPPGGYAMSGPYFPAVPQGQVRGSDLPFWFPTWPTNADAPPPVCSSTTTPTTTTPQMIVGTTSSTTTTTTTTTQPPPPGKCCVTDAGLMAVMDKFCACMTAIFGQPQPPTPLTGGLLPDQSFSDAPLPEDQWNVLDKLPTEPPPTPPLRGYQQFDGYIRG